MKTKKIFLFNLVGLLFFIPTLFIFYNGFKIIKSVNESRDLEQIDASN